MKKMKNLSLFLVFVICITFNGPAFAQQVNNNNLDVQIIDKVEYVEVIENGVINRIYDYIVENTRYVVMTDEYGSVINTITVDLINGEISRDGLSLNIKSSLELKANNIFPQYLDGDGTEENPYKFCTPGATTDIRSHRYSAREIADVAGNANTAAYIIIGIAALSGIPTAAFVAINSAITFLAFLVTNSTHEFYDKIGITFNSKKVCTLQWDFDAGEYVYFYQNSIVCYNGATFS